MSAWKELIAKRAAGVKPSREEYDTARRAIGGRTPAEAKRCFGDPTVAASLVVTHRTGDVRLVPIYVVDLYKAPQ